MAGKGSPKGVRRGGRQKGTPNKASAARQSAMAASGLMPLDYMLQVLRDEEDPTRRAWAANAAAPYCHPRLAQVELGNKGGEAFRVVLEGVDGGIL